MVALPVPLKKYDSVWVKKAQSNKLHREKVRVAELTAKMSNKDLRCCTQLEFKND